MVNKEQKTKGFYSTAAEPSGILSDLVPYSKYKMFMVVANSRFEGPTSNTVEFTTKEGGEDRMHVTDVLLSVGQKSGMKTVGSTFDSVTGRSKWTARC